MHGLMTAINDVVLLLSADDNKPGFGFCDWALTGLSWLLVVMTFPMSLCVCMKVLVFAVVTNNASLADLLNPFACLCIVVTAMYEFFNATCMFRFSHIATPTVYFPSVCPVCITNLHPL